MISANNLSSKSRSKLRNLIAIIPECAGVFVEKVPYRSVPDIKMQMTYSSMTGITVVPWREFCFYQNTNMAKEQAPSGSSLLVVGSEPQLCNWPVVNFVQTLDELKELKELVFAKPLVLLVECGKHVPIGQRLNNRGEILGPSDLEWWISPSSIPWNDSTFHPGGLTAEGTTPYQFLTVKFAVFIDTSHWRIKQQLDEGFRKAQSFLMNKKSFYVEFDFNSVVLSWWISQGPQSWLWLNCLDTAYCIGGRVALTDTGEPCHCLNFGIWWSLCLPCYFMLAVPYKIWRNVICQIWDYWVFITGDVQAVSHISDVTL